jgi:hypothetical protein
LINKYLTTIAEAYQIEWTPSSQLQNPMSPTGLVGIPNALWPLQPPIMNMPTPQVQVSPKRVREPSFPDIPNEEADLPDFDELNRRKMLNDDSWDRL